MKIEVIKATKEKLAELRASSWPVWEKEESEFSWEYSEPEIFYVIEGKAIVSPDDGSIPSSFEAGDIVKMPKGLKCTWKVVEKIRKHYRFG